MIVDCRIIYRDLREVERSKEERKIGKLETKHFVLCLINFLLFYADSHYFYVPSLLCALIRP